MAILYAGPGFLGGIKNDKMMVKTTMKKVIETVRIIIMMV